MGKKGEMLRLQKKQRATYTFTGEQLEAHDSAVIADFRRRYEEDLRSRAQAEEARINAMIDDEWKRREEIFTDQGGNESIFNLLSMTLAVPVAVLMDEFGWRPLPEKQKMHPRAWLARFVVCCEEILNEIAEDENKDIREYCMAVWDRSNVKLEYREEKWAEVIPVEE